MGAGAGPYAKVLAEEMVKPEIEAVVMFRDVQRRVRAAIRQEPYLGFSALGDVYLAGKGEQTATPVAPQPVWSTIEHDSQDKLGGSFDGTWQFTRHAAFGCAEPHATFSLTISNGAISSGGERPITGSVDKAGNITFSRPAGIVKGATQRYVGRLSGNSGSGRFAAAGRCAGSFTATRQ